MDIQLQRIIDFVKKIRLTVDHVHINNYFIIDSSGTPLVIEVTFAGNDGFVDQLPPLPHRYDSPNNPRAEEVRVEFR